MGKKRAAPQAKRAEDRHLSGFMVRLPAIYREKMLELKRKTRRPFTADIQIALNSYFRENGVEPPEM